MIRSLNDLTILDGAFGTMLQKSGVKPGKVPELLNLSDPAVIRGIHAQYVNAGSQAVLANTFGANARKLRGTGFTVREIVDAAIRIVREAAGKNPVRVGLDIGPLGELLEPMGTLSFDAAYGMFAEIAEAGAEAGADFAMIETMTDLQEARAALLAVKEHTALPVCVTMSFDETGRTFTGCTAASMAAVLTGLGADAVGVNCSVGPDKLVKVIREIRRYTDLPIIAKPNAGLPDPEDGHYDMTPEDFSAAMRDCVAAGASIIGGCCGTGPAYIEALCEAMKTPVTLEETEKNGKGFICTASETMPLDRLRLIGERINPTGKKRFQQALSEHDLDYITDVAIRQADAGADILDVNVGMPGIREAEVLPEVVRSLQAVLTIPLQLDSTDPAALDAALRVYCGKAIVNSVSGHQQVMDAVFPVIRKYGAAVIALAMDESGLPQTAEQRVAIADKIIAEAKKYGIPESDIIVDCLTLTVSAQQDQAEETLKAIRMMTARGFNTVLGVSNISFGLPVRSLITQTFLVRALEAGLTMPILNPNQKEIMDTVAAWRVLNGSDAHCAAYVTRMADALPTQTAPAKPSSMTLDDAIIRGLSSEAEKLAKAELASQSELELVESHLIPPLDRVGQDYESGRAFLPQLLSAAQAAQAVFEVIKTSLAAKGGASVKGEKIIIATVQGDIHDIGKNIVRTILANYGYEVLDLGKDVAPERIRDTVTAEHVRLVGLSALMTTTLPSMEKTVSLLQTLPDPPAVFVGGAVVTPDYARKIGADYYAKDARQAVAIAREVFGK